MKYGAVGGVCLLILTGCALPVPLQVASWVIDGVSLVATKKSVADHGLSLVAGKDCALWRGFTESAVCAEIDIREEPVIVKRPEKPKEIVLADTATWSEPIIAEESEEVSQLAEFTTASGPLPVDLRQTAADKESEEVSQLAEFTTASGPLPVDLRQTIPGIYHVIGSYRIIENAQDLIERHEALRPLVVLANLDGRRLHRVIVGPVDILGMKIMRRKLSNAGIKNSWAIRLDPSTWDLVHMPTIRANQIAHLAATRP